MDILGVFQGSNIDKYGKGGEWTEPYENLWDMMHQAEHVAGRGVRVSHIQKCVGCHDLQHFNKSMKCQCIKENVKCWVGGNCWGFIGKHVWVISKSA